MALLLVAGIAHAQSGSRSIGFSKLVFGIDGDDATAIAKHDFRVDILEELRNQGFAVTGAQSLESAREPGETPELLLSGTVRGLECRTLGGACRLAIEWELLDARRDAVVYRALTRAAAYRVDITNPAGVGAQLVRGALRSLTGRPAFRSQLARTTEQDVATGFVDFDDPVPSFEPELDAHRAQAALAQRAREERELQERMARDARKTSEEERKRRIDALTPGYLKVMKWAGAGLAVAGGVAAIVTYSAFDGQKTTQDDYERLRLGNDLAWVAMALGAASFGLSFALTPSLPGKKSATQHAFAVDLKPGQAQVRLCF
ncbi:MAG TPA: hypothetical protein VJV79_06490 [Polyangiaceae bacterium]|nr:hypothetical protein [Polyangiaceae bacterium]